MELWIRNQDRENIIKVELLEIDEREEDCRIITIFQNKGAILGTYKTKERALEVLDEIQRTISKMLINKYDDGYKLQAIDTYIYEMPEN